MSDEVVPPTPPPPPPSPAGPGPSPPDRLRQKVEQILTGILGRVEVDQQGAFSFPFESTRVFVNVAPFHETSVANVYAITNVEVPATPELFRWIATHTDSWLFGHLGAEESDRGVTVVFRRSVLGDFVDPAQLHQAVGIVATTANQIDEEIKRQFGGRLFTEGAAAPGKDPDGDAPGYL